jgi:hypothetical protein
VVVVCLALIVGYIEFVGPNEAHGWPVAEKLVPVAYLAWSIWLVVLGLALIV